ncbi:MAG: hypothetical protein M3539_11395 [Acidobacteriota bacterium]|nr:hypothetical protein [Acidobacteriota bacterium]
MKNMDDNDYLWDGTGKPDPEIKELEEMLGTLRYQPRPLKIPAGFDAGRNRYSRVLAIAAAVALIALGLGVWLGMQKRNKVEFAETKPQPTQTQTAALGPDEKKLNNLSADARTPEKEELPEAPATSDRKAVASNRSRTRRSSYRNSNISAAEVAEAKAAKDQLMLALRVTSSKLNLAQRKTVGNAVHNQHKVG